MKSMKNFSKKLIEETVSKSSRTKKHRINSINEKERGREIREFLPPSCLDSAYQRKAIDEGFEFSEDSLFDENVNYYKRKHGNSTI